MVRPQASLIVLWALRGDHTRRVIERAHERAIATVLRWLENEVAATRWAFDRPGPSVSAEPVFSGSCGMQVRRPIVRWDR